MILFAIFSIPIHVAQAADCVQVGDLTWELKTDDGGLRDKDNTYTWYDSSGPTSNRGNAGTPGTTGTGCTGGISCDTQSYVQAVNAQNLCGHNDWRLPGWEDLTSLVKSGSSPTIDPTLFPETRPAPYWTATTRVENNNYAWSINFNSGLEEHYWKDNKRSIRLVRGPQAPDKCVTVGNLTWEVKSGRGTLRSFEDRYAWYVVGDPIWVNHGNPGVQGDLAGCSNLIHCDTREYIQAVNAKKVCGYDDWRLPTWKELRSLVNHNYGPTIDQTLFLPNEDRTRPAPYWTAATRVENNNYAWSINFNSGLEEHYWKDNRHSVRLVRGPQMSDNGCVTIGNLTWEIKSERGTLRDSDNTYSWYNTVPDLNAGNAGVQGDSASCLSLNNCNTNAYINALNGQNVALCGYTDWRMPTLAELRSLVNYNYGPTIDQTLFLPNEDRTRPAPYWTAATRVENNNYAWSINFNSGLEEYYWKDNKKYVRAVRSANTPPITLSSSAPAHAKPVTGTLSQQLTTLNATPPAFDNTWVAVNRHADVHTDASFDCKTSGLDPLSQPYLSANDFITGANEVTYNNCDSAFYRFTFTIPEGFIPQCLAGEANVDDQGVVFVNGHRISGVMGQNDFGKDVFDSTGLTILTWPTQDKFRTCNTSYFKTGVNELVFGITGDASAFDPTGLEFTAQVTGTPGTATTFALTTTKAGNGSGTVGGAGSYASGVTVTLTATPNAGSTFTGWSPSPCATSFTMPANALTCTATFTTNAPNTFALTTATAGTGSGTVGGAGSYAAGATVTLTATPNAGSTFVGWSPSPCASLFSMPANPLACTATFNSTTSNNALLTVALAGNGLGTIISQPSGIQCSNLSGSATDCSENYAANTTVTLTAVPAVGKIFNGWSGACTGIGLCTITMDAAKNVTAAFATSDPATALITHYYQSILERRPEPDGLAFWQGQVAEKQAQGADVKGVFRQMADFFFNSQEYTARNTTDRQFITNLYLTFFQRQPDEAGYAYWLEQLAGGQSRNDAMNGFLYSPEFTAFMEAVLNP